MATAYWNPAAADDTGNGLSWGAAKKTLAAASTVAGANGTVRVAGQALVAVSPNGTWTAGSTAVAFATEPSLSVGQYIAPTGRTDWPSFRVTAIHQGPGFNVTVAYAWRGTTSGSPEATSVIPTFGLTAGQTLSATGQTLTFGWNPVSGLQDAGYVSAFSRASGSFTPFTLGQANTTIVCGAGLFRVYGFNGGNYGGFRCTASCSFTGTLDLSDPGVCGLRCDSYADEALLQRVICATTAGVPLFRSGTGKIEVAEVILWDASGGTAVTGSDGGTVNIGSFTDINGTGMTIYQSTVRVGLYAPNFNPTFNSVAGQLSIGAISGSPTPTYSGNVSVGGPVALWRVGTTYGVCDKTTGRAGGSDYCLRFTPNSAIFPLEVPLATVAASGATVVLKFWCYYVGTQAPVCQVSLLEPNGLTPTQVQTFTPIVGASWTDATQITVTFTGTTAQLGSLQVLMQVFGNAAGNAVLYVDDMTWNAGAGDQADTSGMGYGGLVPLIQTIAAGGAAGFPLTPGGNIQ
jgi:hypothetical protein